MLAPALALAHPATAAAAGEGWSAARVTDTRAIPRAKQSYGPFYIIDDRTAAMVGVTSHSTPAAFRAMMADHPGLRLLEMRECPGTVDDHANLEVGRLIRTAGLSIRVPSHGSVRSGAVELVFAGRDLVIEDGAEFAVHGWIDDRGHGAADYPADSPEHRKYLDYYQDMGMDAPQAQAFYALTNSVPFEQALWLDGAEMRRWALGARRAEGAPGLARLDLLPVLY